MLAFCKFHDGFEVLLGLVRILYNAIVDLFDLLSQIRTTTFLAFCDYFVDNFMYL